jgi:hypothetical protein
MKTTYQDVVKVADQLPLADKARLIEHLSAGLRHDLEKVESEDWETFVNRMYGALADDPIERPPQLPLEERDPIE